MVKNRFRVHECNSYWHSEIHSLATTSIKSIKFYFEGGFVTHLITKFGFV